MEISKTARFAVVGTGLSMILTAPAPAQVGFTDPMAIPTLDYVITRSGGDDTTSLDLPPDLGAPQIPFDLLSGQLALTDDQHEKIYKAECDCLNKIQPMIAQLQSMQRDLRDALTSVTLDAAKATDLQNKISTQKATITNLWLQHQLGALQALTPDQRAGLRSMMLKTRHRMKRWW